MKKLTIKKRSGTMLVSFSTEDIQLASLHISFAFVDRKPTIESWDLDIKNQYLNLTTPQVSFSEFQELLNLIHAFCLKLQNTYQNDVTALSDLEINE